MTESGCLKNRQHRMLKIPKGHIQIWEIEESEVYEYRTNMC